MNESKIYTRFYLEKPTKNVETEQNDKFRNTKNKKVIIGDDPALYPDGAVTMDEDCDRG